MGNDLLSLGIYEQRHSLLKIRKITWIFKVSHIKTEKPKIIKSSST